MGAMEYLRLYLESYYETTDKDALILSDFTDIVYVRVNSRGDIKDLFTSDDTEADLSDEFPTITDRIQ